MESDFSGFIYATVAQQVEREAEDLRVPGSIPGGGTIKFTGRSISWLSPQPVKLVIRGSIPRRPAINQGSVAQSGEHLPVKQEVGRSKLLRSAKFEGDGR